MSTPYFSDEQVTLYHGDCREIVPAVGITGDLVVTDPPYAETSLEWDIWPAGWPAIAATVAPSLWCFGSARMFDTYRDDILPHGWHLSQDVIWSKGVASTGGVVDRFLRSHEHVRHYYMGPWGDIHHEPVKRHVGVQKKGVTNRAASGKAWHGDRGASSWVDDGTRYAWFLAHDAWPSADVVLDHICENKACVNAQHLRELANSLNIRRAYARGDAATERRRARWRAAHARRRTYSPNYTVGGE